MFEEDYNPYSYNDTDRPPLLRGRCCPKCGSVELFCEFKAPRFWERWLGHKEVVVIRCCDCKYTEKVTPVDQTK